MKIKINILTFFQEANRKKTNNKAMKKNKDRKQNYNISITDNRILDYFKIYDAYKNKLTVVPVLALLVSLATIFLNKNEIQTTYFGQVYCLFYF